MADQFLLSTILYHGHALPTIAVLIYGTWYSNYNC